MRGKEVQMRSTLCTFLVLLVLVLAAGCSGPNAGDACAERRVGDYECQSLNVAAGGNEIEEGVLKCMQDGYGDYIWEEVYSCAPGTRCKVTHDGSDFECADDPSAN
jgi:hypothetical protein